MFESVLRPAVFPGARALIEDCRANGLEPVFLSGSIDVILGPLADHFDITEVICNRLEIRDGVATGRLVRPVVAGATKAQLIRDFARKRGYDPDSCQAYSDSASDFGMLASVGRPAAVNPDWKLRGIARAHDWPILTLGA